MQEKESTALSGATYAVFIILLLFIIAVSVAWVRQEPETPLPADAQLEGGIPLGETGVNLLAPYLKKHRLVDAPERDSRHHTVFQEGHQGDPITFRNPTPHSMIVEMAETGTEGHPIRVRAFFLRAGSQKTIRRRTDDLLFHLHKSRVIAD